MRVTYYLLGAFICLSTLGMCQENNPNNYNFNSAQQPPVIDPGNKENLLPLDSLLSPMQGVVTNYLPQGDIDSLKQEILNLKRDLNYLRTDLTNAQMNLSLSHKKFRVGSLLLGAGVAGYFFGSFSAGNHTGNITSLESLLILGGFGATVTGSILMINSHKYIGKAGVNQRRYNRTTRIQRQ